MNDDQNAEDSGLTAAASSISRGTPVDWSAIAARPDFLDQEDALAELRALETLAQLNDPVPTTWGPFVISGEVGRGAFGVVYRAFDLNLELELALKVIRPKPPKVIDRSRALAEARLLAQIVHPNVVRVHRAEQIGDEVGVAMELIRGTTLAELVRVQGPSSAREAMLMALDLCRALAAVHRAKVLHGDIKAHNVMRAEGGRTVLMDFGSARDLRSDFSDSEAMTGTPLYLAPEVFAGGPRTRASDIYSLGVLLYFLTTGSYPVGGSTRTEVEQRHADGTPRRLLRDVRPDLPDSFIRVVDRALAQLPEDRHQSAGELEEDLSRALALETHGGPTPWTWRRFLAAAVLITIVGVGAMVMSMADWSTSRENSPPNSSGATTVRPSGVSNIPPLADEYRIHAALFREQAGQVQRLDNGARVGPGDRLSLQITATAPIHLYVVNEDEQGEAWLLYPLDADQAAVALPPSRSHRLPGTQGGEQISWQVSSRGGREHFLLIASRERPSAFERIYAGLPRPSFGQAVNYQRVSPEVAQILRGVGGLTANARQREIGAGLAKEFAVPLTAAEETVRGPWVRRLTLENP